MRLVNDQIECRMAEEVNSLMTISSIIKLAHVDDFVRRLGTKKTCLESSDAYQTRCDSVGTSSELTRNMAGGLLSRASGLFGLVRSSGGKVWAKARHT